MPSCDQTDSVRRQGALFAVHRTQGSSFRLYASKMMSMPGKGQGSPISYLNKYLLSSMRLWSKPGCATALSECDFRTRPEMRLGERASIIGDSDRESLKLMQARASLAISRNEGSRQLSLPMHRIQISSARCGSSTVIIDQLRIYIMQSNPPQEPPDPRY